MSYTNAIFYLDYTNGVDTARADLVPSAYANNGAGLVRVTVGGLGSPAIVTGAVVDIAGTTGSVYVGAWIATVIDSTHIDLQNSAYTSNPAAKGTAIPRGGDSWANAWSTITLGATAARLAAGDTIRIAKSPDPYSIGNATWTNGPCAATQVPTSSTNATPIVITKNAHGYVNGQAIQVANHTTNTNANGIWYVANATANTFELQGSVGNGVGGATGTMREITARIVTLASAQTLVITRCETNWTANGSGDATPSVVNQATDAKSGDNCIKILLDAAVQTGIMQAFQATGTLDLSAYQKITFWLKNSAAIVANNYTITLCSDVAGATPVDTFAIPAIPSTAQWVPLTIARNGGGNLGSSIKSIAINTGSVAPTNSSNVLLDIFNACTTNGLNHQSLISKNSAAQGGNEGWWPIQSINGTMVVLDSTVNATVTCSGAGSNVNFYIAYFGVSETVATYARETIKTTMVAANGSAVQTTTKAGTNAARISYLGGYNTSNSAQDGETFFDGMNGFGNAGLANNLGFITFARLNFVRYNTGFSATGGVGLIVQSCFCVSCSFNVGSLSGSITFNSIVGGQLQVSGGQNNDISGVSVFAGGNTALNINSASIRNVLHGFNKVTGGTTVLQNNLNYGNIVRDCLSILGFPAGGGALSSPYGLLCIRNCVHNHGQLIGGGSGVAGAQGYIYSEDDMGVPGASVIYGYNSWACLAANTRTGGTGNQWTITLASNLNDSSSPFILPIGRWAVPANQARTITVWVKKSSASNGVATLVLRGGQINGVAADVTATKANDTNWQQLSVSFTPTEAGVIEAEVQFYCTTGTNETCIVADTGVL